MNTVIEMIQHRLKELGADGLCCPEEQCGCEIDDIVPCDAMSLCYCVAGKKRKPTADDIEEWGPGCKWMMGPLQEAAESEDAQ